MTDNERTLISIVKSVVCNNSSVCELNISDIEDFYLLAKSQDLAHIVGYYLDKHCCQIDSIYMDLFQKEYVKSIYRVVSLNEELRKIKIVFDKNHVSYVPLKGAVMRKIYPEEWMRVSADLDILISPEDLEHAKKLLIDELDYSFESDVAHQVALSSIKGFVVELHRSLSLMQCKARVVLNRVWDYCFLSFKDSCMYQMTNEMLYFYQVFNASKDFQKGGCGVRQVLDIWMMNRQIEFDIFERNKLLEEGGILLFSNVIESIGKEWFSDCNIVKSQYSDVEKYILSGGSHGQKQLVAARQAKSGSRTRYILSRVFPSHSSLIFGYPILKKYPFLIPLCWIHRLLKGLFSGKIKIAEYELKKSKEVIDDSNKMEELFQRLGLM